MRNSSLAHLKPQTRLSPEANIPRRRTITNPSLRDKAGPLPVLFNLANAQQREGQFGPAILNYERAALLAPNDPDIAANLQLARQKAGLAAEPRSQIENVTQRLTWNGWFCFAAAALFLIAVTLPLKQWRPRMRQALNWGSVPAALALTLAITAMTIRLPGLNRAIVTATEATAGVSPVSMAQPAFELQAGEAVRLKQRHGAFELVENRAGKEGWVKASEVVQVIPSLLQTAVPRN